MLSTCSQHITTLWLFLREMFYDCFTLANVLNTWMVVIWGGYRIFRMLSLDGDRTSLRAGFEGCAASLNFLVYFYASWM